MLIHELELNDDKTEYIIFQSKHHDQKYGTTDLDLTDFTFESVTSVRNLFAYFDKHMAMKKYVTEVCRSAYYHIRQIGKIRNSWFLIIDNHVKNKKYRDFVSISSLTGKCAAQK